MKRRTRKSKPTAAMLREYDFRKGVRGKYAQRFAEGTNLVVLAPEVAEVFPDSEAVNDALRTLLRLRRARRGKTSALQPVVTRG